MDTHRIKVSEHLEAASAILGYNRAHRKPTFIVHDTGTLGEYGGTSAELIDLDGDASVIKIANGDERAVDNSEVYFDLAVNPWMPVNWNPA